MHSLPNNFSADPGSLVAAVDIIEFGDFTCSQCRQFRQVLHSILTAFDGWVSYTYYHFPNQHSECSILAAKASEAAGQQGYFWPMHQALYQQSMLSRDTLSTLIIHLGMDVTWF